jgi:hypothetical protein
VRTGGQQAPWAMVRRRVRGGGVALRRAELESFGGEEARGIQRAAAIEEEDDCYNPVSHVGSTLANGTEPSSPETTRGGGGH